MKKLVLAAAIVCVAAVSNAAAIAWQATGIQGSPDVATANLVGSVAYFMDGADYAAFSALSGDKVAAFAQDNALYSANVTAGRGGSLVTATSGNYSAGETVSGFIVIFDNADAALAKNYVATGVDTKTVPGSGSLSFAKVYGTDTGAWQSTAVPEPTSGLLLLLGVAGLALKRKRA